MMDTNEQIRIITKGVTDVIGTDELKEKLERAVREGIPLTVKFGMDPSAPDIHLGHTVVLRKFRQMQDMGHRIVIIIGDFTGMIGDPSGRSKTRKQLSREQVLENARTYQEQVFKILDPEKTELRFNSEWLSALNFRDVIELASKYTVARMLERDDFKNRFVSHQPISVHEFFYPLMQAYDSVAIKADIEFGGTDQRFNILLGRDIQKEYGQESQVAIFAPLLEGIDGVEKMSKSLGNYIGIDEEPNVIYEKVMTIPDSLIIKYYELATDVHPDEIAVIRRTLDSETANPRDVKMNLAKEIVRLYHGEEAAEAAEERFKAVFQRKDVPDDAVDIEIREAEVIEGRVWILKLITAGGFAASGSEARRLVEQGAVKINGVKIPDVESIFVNNGDIIQVGKFKYGRIIIK